MPAPRLRGAEVELLRLVVERPGVGISDAAKELYLAGNSVSTPVKQLARQGCLVRETDRADRRAARLLPTPVVEARLGEWRKRRADLVRHHVSRLDDDPFPRKHTVTRRQHEVAFTKFVSVPLSGGIHPYVLRTGGTSVGAGPPGSGVSS